MLRSRRILTQKLNRDPTVEEIAKDSGFTPERVRELFELVEDPVSLETPVGDGESLYGDLIEDVHGDQPDAATAKQLRSRELAEALLHLNPRMRRVLTMRFGLEGQTPRTLEEVGADLGITRERVRQLESRALRELRTVAPGLQFYLETIAAKPALPVSPRRVEKCASSPWTGAAEVESGAVGRTAGMPLGVSRPTRSRSGGRRFSACPSIWRTRSRVRSSRRPISSSVFGSELSSP